MTAYEIISIFIGKYLGLLQYPAGRPAFFFIRIQMGIGPPGCFNLFMAQVLRYHQVIAHLDQQRGVGVLLRYNKDKSEKLLLPRLLRCCKADKIPEMLIKWALFPGLLYACWL